MKYRIFNILWDIDDGEASTPSEMIIEVPASESERVEDYLCDEISNRSGWCHNGFKYEPV